MAVTAAPSNTLMALLSNQFLIIKNPNNEKPNVGIASTRDIAKNIKKYILQFLSYENNQQRDFLNPFNWKKQNSKQQ